MTLFRWSLLLSMEALVEYFSYRKDTPALNGSDHPNMASIAIELYTCIRVHNISNIMIITILWVGYMI